MGRVRAVYSPVVRGIPQKTAAILENPAAVEIMSHAVVPFSRSAAVSGWKFRPWEVDRSLDDLCSDL